MEIVVKKYMQRFRKVKEEMTRWEELQSYLVSQFINASSIIQRLQIIRNINNYGVLRCIEGIENAVRAKQLESLTSIMFSMKKTMDDFEGVVSRIEKIYRDSQQLVKGGSALVKSEQLHQCVGLKPSIAYCLYGLKLLAEMHQSEYKLKQSVISKLEKLAELGLKSSECGDLDSLQKLLVDQPNIAKEEVQNIHNIIFAEEL